MYKLARQVRFSINPFLDDDGEGANSYASRPCGEGLSLFLGLWVELEGPINPDTGFVINVVEIDRLVRQKVVPIFSDRIRQRFGGGKFIGLAETCELLGRSWKSLTGAFGPAMISQLRLELNPFRVQTILSEDCGMFLFSEKFEFAATHTLWNDTFSEEQNFEMFGKCANPTGHGHNYVIEVTVEKRNDDQPLRIAEYQRVVDQEFLSLVDHRNLNTDVSDFSGISSVENLAEYAWRKLYDKFAYCRLRKITVWETDKTYCTYSGPSDEETATGIPKRKIHRTKPGNERLSF